MSFSQPCRLLNFIARAWLFRSGLLVCIAEAEAKSDILQRATTLEGITTAPWKKPLCPSAKTMGKYETRSHPQEIALRQFGAACSPRGKRFERWDFRRYEIA